MEKLNWMDSSPFMTKEELKSCLKIKSPDQLFAEDLSQMILETVIKQPTGNQ